MAENNFAKQHFTRMYRHTVRNPNGYEISRTISSWKAARKPGKSRTRVTWNGEKIFFKITGCSRSRQPRSWTAFARARFLMPRWLPRTCQSPGTRLSYLLQEEFPGTQSNCHFFR